MDEPAIGEQFGRWTVVGPALRRNGRLSVPCRCECGTERIVLVQSLRRKDRSNPSCGCWRKEVASKAISTTRWKNSHGRAARGEDGQQHPLYQLWKRINRRCYNPNSTQWKWYGERGIQVWEGWRNDAGAFIEYIERELGPRPEGMSLDRVDNEGNYEPGNLRWATQSQQVLNSRTHLRRDGC